MTLLILIGLYLLIGFVSVSAIYVYDDRRGGAESLFFTTYVDEGYVGFSMIVWPIVWALVFFRVWVWFLRSLK